MRAPGFRRSRLRVRTAVAYSPAAITNFFKIQFDSSHSAIAATGGGYILSRGTRTKAGLRIGRKGTVSTIVNGDRRYKARTTKRAVGLLLAAHGRPFGELQLKQLVETPIGSGFGSSAASAISAVYATSAVMNIDRPKQELAFFAHQAEIIEQTGLGTVSVVYDAVGAGAIIEGGVPGAAHFVNVEVPTDARLVTAYIAPYDKRKALSSRLLTEKINTLGSDAIRGFLSDPSLDTIAEEGERFSKKLGLESHEVRKLADLAKAAGAKYASQNMIGYAVHALVDQDRSKRVAEAFSGLGSGIRVDTFEVGTERAGVIKANRT